MKRFACFALLVASFGIGLPATLPAAGAEPAGWTEQDADFDRLIMCDTNPGSGCMVTVSDFGLLRNQALWVCRLQDEGMDLREAIYALKRAGPYSFDQANNISAAATVAYCSDNIRR